MIITDVEDESSQNRETAAEENSYSHKCHGRIILTWEDLYYELWPHRSYKLFLENMVSNVLQLILYQLAC